MGTALILYSGYASSNASKIYWLFCRSLVLLIQYPMLISVRPSPHAAAKQATRHRSSAESTAQSFFFMVFLPFIF